MKKFFFLLIITFNFSMNICLAETLAETVKTIKPSVVGIGIYTPLGSPRAILKGTGFVVGNGHYIVTNHHVIAKELDSEKHQKYIAFVGEGRSPKLIDLTMVGTDPAHDVAIFSITTKLPALTLSSVQRTPDGSEIAFTGFPIGAVLGLYPATHRGIIAAFTPIVIPTSHSSQLSIGMLKQLRDPFMVYQLDATAYPGNSGSPVYHAQTGEVLGVINQVYVKHTKESVLSDPSGISYAIPIRYVKELASKLDIDL